MGDAGGFQKKTLNTALARDELSSVIYTYDFLQSDTREFP